MQDTTYPFSAIVGQDDLKNALLIAAIDPSIGGVLAFGDRGTGKTTAIRALAALLPQHETVAGCRYGCAPDAPQNLCEKCQPPDSTKALISEKSSPSVVDLPLGATEDRVLGSLDLERALAGGELVFEPGLLASAHRGFLYVDEVNLLDDHLVDILLDVAVSGINRIEREGLSLTHAARFVLVGSGNPEEGELRPQLLDRFGLSVEVATPTVPKDRVEIIKRRTAFDLDRKGFIASYRRKENTLRRKIVSATENLADVTVPDEMLELAAKLCIALGSDGLRGELALIRAARGFAALAGKPNVDLDCLRQAAPMALSHRLRKDPLDDSRSSVRVARAVEECFGP
ncbi:MAG: magnesium chelatase ATPase subunit I [Pseudomonadota bacterium]